MIDLHTHVLPGIDDGSQSMDMSLEMLSLATESGVDTLVTTPHCNIPGEYENYVDDELAQLWDILNEEKERLEIPIRLCKGMEIYATPELPELLQEKRLWTLNDTSYFLVEFAFDEDPDFCWFILRACVELGYQPIIAHPERYFFVQGDPELAFEWCTAAYGGAPDGPRARCLRRERCAPSASAQHVHGGYPPSSGARLRRVILQACLE